MQVRTLAHRKGHHSDVDIARRICRCSSGASRRETWRRAVSVPAVERDVDSGTTGVFRPEKTLLTLSFGAMTASYENAKIDKTQKLAPNTVPSVGDTQTRIAWSTPSIGVRVCVCERA